MDHSPVPGRRQKAIIQKSRLAAYAAAGTTISLAGTQGSDAAIVYTQVGVLVRDTATGGGFASHDLLFDTFHLGMLHSLGADTAASGYAIIDPDLVGLPQAQFAGFAAQGASAVYNYVTAIPAGSAINSLAFLNVNFGTMAFNAGFGNSEFLTAGTKFIGVQFDTNRFGWIRVNMTGAPLNAFTIVDFAYGGPNEAIAAGQVPEPGSLGLLALGATGLATWRRRRAS